jgi:hypothetical protein
MSFRQRAKRIFRDWDKQGLVESRGDYLLLKDIVGLQREMVPLEEGDSHPGDRFRPGRSHHLCPSLG